VFEVIPAIDISHGRLARLTARGPMGVAAFDGDPLAAAAAFLRAGVPRLHVVDLDLATEGAARNLDTIEAIVGLGAPVQVSGGAATSSEVELLLGVGADRAVLGSAALADRVLVAGLVERLGERLAIGVETDGDRIRSRGRRAVDLPLTETLAWLAETSAARFLVTGVARVGGLAGPDLEGLLAVVAMGRPVIGAGGVASLEDLLAIRDAGAEGAIVGRAALEGSLDLAAARRVVGAAMPPAGDAGPFAGGR
jgi:phosphoribosylformimino-5-aminoimidazole carboxamide ribonucleotide (ProFAR) isomerase